MDPENVGKEAILKVTDWLRGIWEMRRKTGPVQQWVDSIPSPTKPAPDARVELEENSTPPLTPVSVRESVFVKPTMTVSMPIAVPSSPVITMTGVSSPIGHSRLARDPSFQSDSSHCSSVESLLELRRADPEAILLGLGFGGCPNNSQENGPLSRIPKRFLQPSKLQGITINDFVKHEQETNESLDSASLGYRGLTGSPYVAPSEIVQKIMERLREHESHEQDAYMVHNTNTEPYSPIFQDTSRLSVLSPDNRQFLERPRSKSPDMRNKRMIIGQKSFAFGCDGDLIEIEPLSHQDSKNSSTNGNADNHEIELEDKFVFGEFAPNVNLATTNPDEAETNSTMSKIKLENRLSKQLFIDDSAQDLSTPSSNSLPNEVRSRSGEDSTELGSSESSRRFDDGNRENWKVRGEEIDDDRTLINSPRRSSCDSCDVKKVPWSRLSRDERRRYSDGSLRQPTDLLNRRRSLKRQPRISDAEAVQYCESDSPSNPVVPEENDGFEVDRNAEETPGISESTKLEGNETDKEINRSDRLSTTNTEETLVSSMDKFLTPDIDVPTEINTDPDNDTVKIEDSSTKKREKKKRGLSAILGMYSSVTSVRMEPGF